MVRNLIVAVLMFSLVLGGCLEKKPVKVATPPPAPIVPLPAPPPEPPAVIATQNTAVLPAEQPIPAGAVPVHDLPPPPSATAEERETPARRTPSSRGQRSTTAEPAATPPAAATTTSPAEAPPEEPPSSRLEPSSRGAVRSAAEIGATINEVSAMVQDLGSRKLDNDSRAVLNRVRSLLRLSQDGLNKGNLVQADDLIKRADSIARDLLRRH